MEKPFGCWLVNLGAKVGDTLPRALCLRQGTEKQSPTPEVDVADRGVFAVQRQFERTNVRVR